MRAVGRGHRLKKEKWARECNRGRVPATWLSMTRRVIVGFGIVLVGCGPLMPSVDDSMSAADETGAHHGTTSGASAGVTGNGPATGEDVTTGSADETTADDSSQPKLDVSPACVSSDDCILLDTCCGCDAAPGDRPPPDRCPVDCAEGQCSALGIDAPVCVFGQCRASRDCDVSGVRCAATPPACPQNMLPSVVDGCWGSCLPASTCLAVSSCDDCPDDHVCVPLVGQGVFRCAELDPECADTPPSCDCIDPQTCLELTLLDCFDTEDGPACEPASDDPPG